jgi:hypothetical protein
LLNETTESATIKVKMKKTLKKLTSTKRMLR